MGETTGISWTHHTFNPWWGCQKVSDGCKHCYAEHLAVNRRKMPIWGPAATTHRKMMSEDYWKQPLKWNRKAAEAGVRERVFCASMADVFEDHPDVVEARARLWELIEQTPALDWLLLTKRPENIVGMVESMLPYNVWLGTSAETQDQLDKRAHQLTYSYAGRWGKHHFLSLEPLLGPIDLRRYLQDQCGYYCDEAVGHVDHNVRIDWVIVGGESGPGCRPMDPQWARDIRDQCREAGIAFFFKQHGGTKKINGVAGGDLLDGVQYHEWPGDAPTEIPVAPEQPERWEQGGLL